MNRPPSSRHASWVPHGLHRFAAASLCLFLHPAQAGSAVTRRGMQQFGRQTVGGAAALPPCVTLPNHSRNERLVYLRGFDARQVAKGFSSIADGPNGMAYVGRPVAGIAMVL